MNKYKVAMAILATMSLLACGKGFEVPEGVQGSKLALKGLPPEEILKTKYDRAELKCNIWMQKSAGIDLRLAPNTQVSIDLKSPNAWPVSNKASVVVENHKITASLAVESVTIVDSVNLTSNDWVYKLKNTPQVKYTFEFNAVTNFTSGPVISKADAQSKEINEGLTQTIAASALGNPERDGFTYNDYITCSLETQLKPEYQDEYQVDALK